MLLVCVVSVPELVHQFLDHKILPLYNSLQSHDASVHFFEGLDLGCLDPFDFALHLVHRRLGLLHVLFHPGHQIGEFGLTVNQSLQIFEIPSLDIFYLLEPSAFVGGLGLYGLLFGWTASDVHIYFSDCIFHVRSQFCWDFLVDFDQVDEIDEHEELPLREISLLCLAAQSPRFRQ